MVLIIKDRTMINNYLNFLNNEDQQLNEFIVLPMVMLSTKLYKKYHNFKIISKQCDGKQGIEKKKCFILYKINAFKKIYAETNKFKTTCKKWSKNVPKCISKVDKELEKTSKKINKLKIKLTKM